jgi:putative drug exporter of the RND superfamily
VLVRLSEWCYTRRWRVLLIWVAALVASIVLAGRFAGDHFADYSSPGSDSKRAFDLLTERFPERSGDTIDVVWRVDSGRATDPAVRASIEQVVTGAQDVEHVEGAVTPWSEEGARQVSADGRVAYASLLLDVPADRMEPQPVLEVMQLVEQANRPGLQVEAGGGAVVNAEVGEVGSEGIGLVAAALILLLTFGSLLAMGLPILTAIFGLAIASSLTSLLLNVVDVPDWAPSVAAMIGIGVGIDYALFIITRYRTGLQDGMDPHRANLVAMATAGRAVIFAGCTVVVSLLGMLLMGLSYTPGVAYAAAISVLVVMAASVTLLPAILGFTGRHIDRFKVPFVKTATGSATQRGFWWRWSRVIQRRPWPAAVAGLVALLALTAPVLDIRFGFPDAANSPDSLTSRRAYDLLSEGFGPGFNGPLFVAVDGSAEGAARLADALRADPGVASVTPPVPNPAGDAAQLIVFPTTSPQDVATEDLIDRLREDVVPPVERATGIEALIGGITASGLDSSRFTAQRLPLFIGGVVVLSFLLLLVVFRSVLVALKAALMNLLSIGAAYGVMALAVQGGWFGSLLGIEEPTPVPAFIPMMMFAILFGLSMDYEVFLLSRVREEYDKTHDNGLAVADGLAATARVITAAAAIMVTVFLVFVFSDQVFLKMIGLGLATAIFVDATVVRMVLVPATMELLGDANWWLPGWLDRLLPQVHVEGHVEDVDAVDLELRDIADVPEPA